MSALTVDDALQAIAALQQEKAELLAALKVLERTAMLVGLVPEMELNAALNEHITAIQQARIAIAHAERAK